jgi:hypothetical protein
MNKQNKGLRPVRGFGQKSRISIDAEEDAFMQMVTIVACRLGAKKLAELDTSKTQSEWLTWMLDESDERVSAAMNEGKNGEGLEFLLKNI